MKYSIFVSCLLGLLLASCASAPTPHDQQPDAEGSREIVRLFYGTNRNRRADARPSRLYGQYRGDYEFGSVAVSGVADEEKTVIDSVQPMMPDEFHHDLRAAVAEAEEPTVLVFVHGFLRSFNQVSRSVAEFVGDTGFAGVPVVWSWPSTSNPARYTMDETNIDWALPDFADFLESVITESGAQQVHLVAHSLGGRSLSKALVYKLIPAGVDLSSVGELVLLAPDIDQEIFRREFGPALLNAGLRVSLYTSANDKAMASARAVHGYRRAGDSEDGPVLVPGMEVIDVTPANRSFLGHSYFGESPAVAEDLGLLLNRGLPAAERPGMRSVKSSEGEYWRLSVENQ